MQDNRLNAERVIQQELSYLVNGCVFDVYNEVGPGLHEESYQKAMEVRLAEKGIPFAAKPATRGELIETHLRLTDCDIGLIVNFGKTKLMLRGVGR